MGRILLGAIIGAALGASVAFIALDRLPSVDGAVAEGASPARTEPHTTVERGTSDATAEQTSPNSDATTPTASVAGESLSVEELEVRLAEVNQVRNALDRELRRARAAETRAAWAAEPPPTLPIALPPEFEYLSGNSSFERLQREPIDPDWYAQAEAQLYAYLAANPRITQKYGYPTIHCRMTACGVAFLSHDPTLAETPFLTSHAAFTEDNLELFEGPWGDQFSDQVGILADIHIEDGVTTFYWRVLRDEQQTNAVRTVDVLR